MPRISNTTRKNKRFYSGQPRTLTESNQNEQTSNETDEEDLDVVKLDETCCTSQVEELVVDEDKSNQPVASTSTNDGDNESDDNIDEDVVDKIVGHYLKDNKMVFVVTWRNYPIEDVWWLSQEELERNCYSLLVKYCKKHKLPIPKQPKNYSGGGPRISSSVSRINWPTMEQVLQEIQGLKRKCRIEIPIVALAECDEISHQQDCIYIILTLQHYYVLYHLPRERLNYIADGLNDYLENEETVDHFKELWNISPIPIRVRTQRAVDYCASSAILIAVEFSYCNRANRVPEDINVVPVSTLRQLVKKLHKGPSEKLAPFSISELSSSISCDKCGKRYRQKDYRRLRGHKEKCSVEKPAVDEQMGSR